jgi:hypothetical protein
MCRSVSLTSSSPSPPLCQAGAVASWLHLAPAPAPPDASVSAALPSAGHTHALPAPVAQDVSESAARGGI